MDTSIKKNKNSSVVLCLLFESDCKLYNCFFFRKLGPIESPKIRIRNIDSPPVPIITRDCESPKTPLEPKTSSSPRQGSPTVLSSTSKNRPLKASHDIKIQSADNSTSPGDRLKSGSGNQVRGRRTVMTMKEGINGAQIVTLGMPSDQGITHVPTPPPLERPRSAQRFRKMVMDCRDT